MMIRTKVVANFKGDISGFISEGERIVVQGKVMYHDGSRWKPLSGIVKVMLNGVELRRFHVKEEGFVFSLALPKGKHMLEIRYIGSDEYEPSYKILKIQVLSRDEKRSLMKFASLAYIFSGIVYMLLLLLLVLALVLIVKI